MAKTPVSRIAALMIAALAIGTDFTGALLLIPQIETEFGVDITTTQWVLNLYALFFAAVLVAGGRLGDMFGRRRVILISLGIFATASVGCLFSPSIGWLIGARAVQGLGAGLLWPSILALGSALFGDERRSVGVGLVLAGITSGNVVGPLIGGASVAWGDWRLFFAVNIVLAALSLLLVFRFVPREPGGKTQERVDYLGMLVNGSALAALLYALDVGGDWGWSSPGFLGLVAASLVLFVVFPQVEKRVRDPLMPAALLRNRDFLLALSTNGLIVPSIFISFLYFPQYFQKALGWSVLEASFGMLPLMVLLAVMSGVAGRFYDSLGPKRMLLLGFLLLVPGCASVVALTFSWGYYAIVPAMICIGLGTALVISAAGTVAVSAVPPARAGLAGGLLFTVHLSTGALGVAGGTAIMYASSATSLSQGLARADISMSAADQATINAAMPGAERVHEVLAKYGDPAAETIRTTMTDAFVDGLRHTFWLTLAAAILGVLAVLAINEQKLKSGSAGASDPQPPDDPGKPPASA